LLLICCCFFCCCNCHHYHCCYGSCCYYTLTSLQFVVWDYEILISTSFTAVRVMAVSLISFARKSCTSECGCYVIHIKVPWVCCYSDTGLVHRLCQCHA
jgi:hypothetical protein